MPCMWIRKSWNQRENLFIIGRASRRINKQELKYRLEGYGKIKCIDITQDKYGRLGNVGVICFETKEEANTSI